jgi:hypothetical protein
MDRRLVHEVPALDHRLFQAQSLSTAAAHVMGPSVNPPLAEDGGTRQEPSGEPGRWAERLVLPERSPVGRKLGRYVKHHNRDD